MTRRRWSVVSAVLLAAVVAAGCTTSGKGSSGDSRSATVSTTSASPTPSLTEDAAPPSTSATATTSTAASTTSGGTPGCTSGQLTVTGVEPPGGSGAGHTGVLLVFTNFSTATCTLFGYPGVDGLDAADVSIAHATRTLNGYLGGCRCTRPPTVTLAPGGAASALVEGSIGGGDCDRFHALFVTPPNTSTSTRVALVPHSCDFTVHPVVAGASG